VPKKIVKKRSRSKPNVVATPCEVGPAAAATAIIGLVYCGLKSLHLLSFVAESLQSSLVAYVAGLCVLDEHATACAMADKLGISHDRLTRLTAWTRVSASVVARLFVGFAQSLGHPGWLIIDDVLLPHRRGKKMEGVYWDYDHAQEKKMLGMRVVVVLWTDGFFRIPLAFAVWHKKDAYWKRYRSKNAIARILLRWVIRKGIHPQYVAFDAWYASKQNLKLCIRLNLIFVTRIKKNCRLSYQGKKLQAKTIGYRLLKARRGYTFRGLALQGRSAKIDWGTLVGLTFVAVKEALDEEKPSLKYLLSNGSPTARQVIERYKSRWIVEVFFRDTKQHLGLAAYQGRSLEGAIRHLSLVFLAAVVLDSFRSEEMTLGDVKRTAQRLLVIYDASGHPRLAIQTLPDWSGSSLLEDAKEIVEPHLDAVCGLRLPNLKRRAA